MARPSKSIERRGEILAAFERCVIERGFERTTLANVAEKVGLPRSLVRHFIGNRDEMTKALIDRLLERAQGQIDAMPSQQRLDDIVRLLMGTVFDDPTTNIVIMELWHVAIRDDELRGSLAGVYDSFIERVATMLADEPDAQMRQRAYAAVSLAFGSAFFRYLGMKPPIAGKLDQTAHACLANATGVAPPGLISA